MAEGIILAGGFSSRTQNNKMLLNIDNKPLIIHTINSMKPFVERIIVVTGHYDQEIRKALQDENVEIYYNENYPDGMFSSVLRGVKETKDDFFIMPGDIPFVKNSTYMSLLNGTKDVRYPRYKGKDGHPLFLKKEMIKKLLQEPMDSNLKAFRDRQDCEAIEVEDENINRDIDTMDEYKEIVERNKLL